VLCVGFLRQACALVVVRLEIHQAESITMTKLCGDKPPAYDSQPTGATEVGVMLARGLVRTLKLSLEAKLWCHG
jgi:hypothetical protein